MHIYIHTNLAVSRNLKSRCSFEGDLASAFQTDCTVRNCQHLASWLSAATGTKLVLAAQICPEGLGALGPQGMK